MDLVPEMLGSGTSIPYLATVGSLAQSQHLLQSLGHDLLPLVQKLLLPVTEIKAQAQVQVPRAASCGMGVGCWMTVQWRGASGQASFLQEQTHIPWNPSERSHQNQTCPPPG